MPVPQKVVGAVIGISLMALLLAGSSRNATINTPPLLTFEEAEIRVLIADANAMYVNGNYMDARAAFRNAALRAEKAGIMRRAARSWNSAGVCSLVELQFRTALEDFLKARRLAEATKDDSFLAQTLNNLANLYLQMDQKELASRVASEALAGPAQNANGETKAKLRLQLGTALAELNRLPEAEPIYRAAIADLISQKDLYNAAVAWGQLGYEYLKHERFADSEVALNTALEMMRANHFRISAGVLSGLGTINGKHGDTKAAEELFAQALELPPNITPRHQTYLDRGQFRLSTGNLMGAIADFRQVRTLLTAMRADIVPADLDRVAFEQKYSEMYEGIVDTGNRIARTNGDKAVLRETFDAAEQARLWSLRALIPSPNDWRTKLPDRYWELLSRYQSLERGAIASGLKEADKNVAPLRRQLEQLEAEATGTKSVEREPSPLTHAQGLLDADTVLFSFHISKTSSWVWAVDRSGVDVYPLPPIKQIRSEVAAFSNQVRSGSPSMETGAQLYQTLFGAIPASALKHRKWLLELDDPLYDIPLAALVPERNPSGPVYLIERAELQSLPGALLAERGGLPANGEFLGVGDPVYNQADSRYRGDRRPASLLLARLPNTSDEVQACAKAWNSKKPTILTGSEAQIDRVQTALESHPSIIHFATHVVTEPGDFRSGMIALSLNPRGEMGLLGPKEIVARPFSPALVVMDGCHSAQGTSVASAGLMGLTRAWIGAGAMSVVATRWDIPDGAAQALMTDFYKALQAAAPRPDAANALQHAQLAALQAPGGRQNPASWAGYFLLSRVL